jgi:ADP-heptose:LPS heptosyltransferase
MSDTLIIYRLGSLGDTVVALPCFHRIERRFPDHRRIVLTNFPVSSKAAPIEAILTQGGFIHGAIAYPLGTRSPRHLLRLVRSIRALRAETLVYVGGGRGVAAAYRDVLFFRLAGIRHVIGAPLTRDLDACRPDPSVGGVEYEGTRLARCLADLGPIDLTDPASWDLRLTEFEVARAEALLSGLAGRRFIAVNTGGKLAVQDWGEANWAALLARLAGTLAAPLVFVGGPEDSDKAQRLAAGWQHPVVDACGRLNPRETAALLRRACLFVGHDSGALHLAAANGVPCVAMFGSNNPPGKWYPRGTRHRFHYDGTDVRRIAPDDVAASVLAVWRATESVSLIRSVADRQDLRVPAGDAD